MVLDIVVVVPVVQIGRNVAVVVFVVSVGVAVVAVVVGFVRSNKVSHFICLNM